MLKIKEKNKIKLKKKYSEGLDKWDSISKS